MKYLITVVLASLAITTLGACNKQPEGETAATTQPAPAANEAATNDSGTTTYYGSPEEQAKN